MSFPRAELAHPSFSQRARRWIRQRLAPPRALETRSGFNAAAYWSLTAALAAGVALGLYLLLVSGNLARFDFTLAVGGLLFVAFGVVFFFWPFLASYYMYLPLAGLLRGRIAAATFCALWHMAAHCALVDVLGSGSPSSALLAPLVVGALWGSWLPAALAPVEDDLR